MVTSCTVFFAQSENIVILACEKDLQRDHNTCLFLFLLLFSIAWIFFLFWGEGEGRSQMKVCCQVTFLLQSPLSLRKYLGV